MATHSSVLAWRIPGTGKPGGLPSMGPHRVGHDMQQQQQQHVAFHKFWYIVSLFICFNIFKNPVLISYGIH